jgi:hypothetical protein
MVSNILPVYIQLFVRHYISMQRYSDEDKESSVRLVLIEWMDLKPTLLRRAPPAMRIPQGGPSVSVNLHRRHSPVAA